MPTRDANNATWYILHYSEDFTPRAPTEMDPSPPRIGSTLFYDDDRHVLELLPRQSTQEVIPLFGVAVDVNGEIYRVDNKTRRLMVRRCDDSEEPFQCEPQILVGPNGLAFDRRGFLYVSDPPARRVVVLRPEDGSVAAVLNGGLLAEPVDVAVSPAGRIYVADRGGGQIALYRARHARAGTFVAQNAESLPETPRPIAVMVDSDETVIVADANHPRLLHFSSDGTPLADVSLESRAAVAKTSSLALDALQEAYGSRLPRFFAGMCEPPRPVRDGGEKLAEVHKDIRLLSLRLGRQFESSGIFISAALDGGRPGTIWHRIEVDADLPAKSSVTIEASTGENPAEFDPDNAEWHAPMDSEGRLLAFSAEQAEQLIQTAPGRYLWLRVTLTSEGFTTPSLRSIRVFYPRVSYLDLLPRVYRRDPESERFMEHFLALFERSFTGIEDRYEEFSREINPDAAPQDIIDWLACLVDLSFDPSWSLEKRRALVASAMELYRRRGTVDGLAQYVEIYTGILPVIIESYLKRPARPAFLGRRGSILGCPLALTQCAPDTTPTEQLYLAYAHRFTVYVYLEDECDAELTLPVVDRIVTTNKPAHTEYVLCPVYPEAQVGLKSTVGLDLVLGGKEVPRTQIGACPKPDEPEIAGDILGVDSILGPRYPYTRPGESQL